MTWSVFHSESEKLAIEAQLAAQIRNHDLARELYRRAAEAERRALALVGTGKARTRAITAVSAVALSFKAREFPAAEQLAHEMLADASLPEFARADLRNLVQAIWTEAAKQSAGVSFLPGQVTVSVKGGEVVTGGAPLDLIVEKVQTIQSLSIERSSFCRESSTAEGEGRPRKSKTPVDRGSSKLLQAAINLPWQFRSRSSPTSSRKTLSPSGLPITSWKS